MPWAREVGVPRWAATNWARGYKTYRNGVVVGFVSPLDPLAVRRSGRATYSRTNGSRSPISVVAG
ncbi:hypothetical protein PDG61_20480 [Mycolicibacterium sp. BiH015]|uniref:hypothetical protein n=1 Tax=Mycolicibacterium sp. BiH015 TaxID=3018808 RepID=UPI0022E91322|nr:hypothetical protein [Mycolicibacterium sp. BiH015]MDA2893305.1 hypothetical protein [Mycolicibacterium sp. BiH015]